VAQAPRIPIAVERAMALVIRRSIERLGRAVLGMQLGQFAHQDAADGGAPGIPGATSIVKSAKAAARAASSGLAVKVQRHSQGEFKRLGISLRDVEPGFGELIDDWRTANVARVGSLLEGERDELADILSNGANKTVTELRGAIEDRLDVSRAKADYLARDQVTTLNSQISHERMRAAGIEEGYWTTSNDERVRDSHAEMDGELFSIDDPPEVDGEAVLPGEPPLCRCVTMPRLPEVEDDSES
jgi:SPP1 gp7 family putative phage head morphogenesis protein